VSDRVAAGRPYRWASSARTYRRAVLHIAKRPAVNTGVGYAVEYGMAEVLAVGWNVSVQRVQRDVAHARGDI